MAERKVQPNTQVLTLAAVGGTEKLVVCITQLGYNYSRSTIDASSFCGADIMPGQETFDVTFTGQRMLGVTDNISEYGLFFIIKNNQRIQWTLGPIDPVEGDIVYSGEGFLNTLNTDNSTNAVPTMTGTINAIASTVDANVTPADLGG